MTDTERPYESVRMGENLISVSPGGLAELGLESGQQVDFATFGRILKYNLAGAETALAIAKAREARKP